MSVLDPNERDTTGDGVENMQPTIALTSFQRDMLFVVARLGEIDPSGVRIKTELQEVYGTEINHGRFYQNLDKLVEEKFVKKRSVNGRTNAYQVSSSGHNRLRAQVAWERLCLPDEERGESS